MTTTAKLFASLFFALCFQSASGQNHTKAAAICTAETEAPFTGEYWDHHENGNYSCKNCGHTLFSSNAKFNSGTGWPSFDEPAIKNGIAERQDTTLGMVRTEVICANCKVHLGHLFADGPTKSGLRYCVNSYALEFKDGSEKENK